MSTEVRRPRRWRLPSSMVAEPCAPGCRTLSETVGALSETVGALSVSAPMGSVSAPMGSVSAPCRRASLCQSGRHATVTVDLASDGSAALATACMSGSRRGRKCKCSLIAWQSGWPVARQCFRNAVLLDSRPEAKKAPPSNTPPHGNASTWCTTRRPVLLLRSSSLDMVASTFEQMSCGTSSTKKRTMVPL